MSEYDITKLVDSPPAGYARVEAFLTAKPDAVYAIVPRRVPEFAIDDIEAPSGVRVTLVEGGGAVESKLAGKRLTVRMPESLPHRPAYAFKLAGAR
jgi:alpha-L-fucosidase